MSYSTTAKEYSFEMGHRLQNHNGLCRNVHGHSYKLAIELEGELNQDAMIIDFYDLDAIMLPIIQVLDHAFICDKSDSLMLSFLSDNNMKFIEMDGPSTVENITIMLAGRLSIAFRRFKNIKAISLKLNETSYSYSSVKLEL